ncbi:hypothetical protein EMCRGX_G017036 [Ephydatia muelleri]|eukprot:Em0008g372a
MARSVKEEQPCASDNARRTYTIMPREESESGKRSNWTELEIRGPIKNLSPSLWSFTHLTALYLNDNNLQRIPSDIALLTCLQRLDLSGNKLRSLPAELGDMTHLRELLLNNNILRVLPYELGKLFLLRVLGISGNPLQSEILSMVNEVNGTDKLLGYLLDNLTVCPRPPDREWIQIQSQQSRLNLTFTVMSYNVLCDKYATRQQYGYCPTWALVWDYRKQAILKEILDSTADIVALQEVETDQYHSFFRPELQRQGYDGIFSAKSRAKTMGEHDRRFVDGCAIFYDKRRFTLLEDHLVEFNQIAVTHASGSEAMLNRVMIRDNIGIAVLLELKDTGHHILVANAHIHWDPEFKDVKLIQTIMLMNELESIVFKAQNEKGIGYKTPIPGMPGVPIVLCGDLNSLPKSGVVEYLLQGRVTTDHPDFQEFAYDAFLHRLRDSVRPGQRSPAGKLELVHQFNLKEAYADHPLQYTNYTYDFKGVIDYIFYSLDFLTPIGLLGPVSTDWLKQYKIIGCPNPHFSSDHFPLLCEYDFIA